MTDVSFSKHPSRVLLFEKTLKVRVDRWVGAQVEVLVLEEEKEEEKKKNIEGEEEGAQNICSTVMNVDYAVERGPCPTA